MHITLIIPLELGAVGCRLLSSHLRANGHQTRLIFIPGIIDALVEEPGLGNTEQKRCSTNIKKLVLEAVQASDLVGFHILTRFFNPMADLSQMVREKSGIPVVWGGVHATLAPNLCMPYTDFLCIGDGEDFMLDLVNHLATNRDYSTVEGLVFWDQGKIVRNRPRPSMENLDDYPFPDYSFQDHHLILTDNNQEKMVKVTLENYGSLQKKYPSIHDGITLVPYKTISTRGCPFVCTYCSMGTLGQDSYPFRTRSPKNLVDEIVASMEAFGDKIGVISISDDTFLSHNREWLNEFSSQYKARVNKPFRILGFPLNVRREVIENLVDAGCMHIGMGIESLSERILYDIYRRKTSPKKVLEAANVLVDISKSYGILPPTFDLIYSNPYETMEDMMISIRGVAAIHHPFKVVVFNMNFFPNTELFNRAVKDGHILEHDQTSYNKWVGDTDMNHTLVPILYDTIWLGQAPEKVIQFLTRPSVFNVLNRLTNGNQMFRQWLGRFLPGLALSIRKKYLIWYLRHEIIKLFR